MQVFAYFRVATKQQLTIWTVMVEKAIVHRDSSITFKFYNGAEIHVGNEKVCW